MATTFKNPAIQPGSTVLVTGVNGFIGSHVADQFLRAGYCVRGTARDTAKVSWIAELFTETYGAGRFELFCVPDIAAGGAFNEAVKGVSAFVHVASNVSFDADPAKVIPPAVGGAMNALKAANGEPSVKRYVLTSSSFAVSLPKPDTAVTVTKDTWNEESIRIAESPSNFPEQAFHNYAASKALAEKEVWRAYHEGRTRPDLVVNTVLPSANFGKILSVPNQGHPSTSKFIEYLWKGENIDQIAGIPPRKSIKRLHCLTQQAIRKGLTVE
ncbi:hypothetical protein SLS55_010229 [Diplodia seriata]|uniref:NAD-dependent epimerase/dehydratase domain-containing protein n=1 Tax=Diplodia seriata TaxID=420778 RepID=A0ABR3BXZ9_9PEZI